jgi:hypothetical protein
VIEESSKKMGPRKRERERSREFWKKNSETAVD